jgi:DNA-binding CsgD family transcriptional regulator
MAQNVDAKKPTEPGRQHVVNPGSYYPAIVLALASLFFAWDIVVDVLDADENLLHVLIELLVFLAISTVLFVELKRVGQLKRQIIAEQNKTARLSGELLAVMQKQFVTWGLSPSETEVALLLIKGLTMKEISVLRQVREKTVRQQATSIYTKSGAAGRHELAAYFIEDLMRT